MIRSFGLARIDPFQPVVMIIKIKEKVPVQEQYMISYIDFTIPPLSATNVWHMSKTKMVGVTNLISMQRVIIYI